MDYRYWNYQEETEPKKPTLRELEAQVKAIEDKKDFIRECGLSEYLTNLALIELDQQKKPLLELMHQEIDKL